MIKVTSFEEESCGKQSLIGPKFLVQPWYVQLLRFEVGGAASHNEPSWRLKKSWVHVIAILEPKEIVIGRPNLTETPSLLK